MNDDLTTKAIDIDRERREGKDLGGASVTRREETVNMDSAISMTAAVHARGALENTIEKVDPKGEELWISWPLRVVVAALDDAIEQAHKS